MHITGNESFGNSLHWFADRSDGVLPQASVLTAPLWFYKALILLWALWLSFALLRWLPWAWKAFVQEGLWRPSPKSSDERWLTMNDSTDRGLNSSGLQSAWIVIVPRCAALVGDRPEGLCDLVAGGYPGAGCGDCSLVHATDFSADAADLRADPDSCIILMIGGHYTYAEVPIGDWVRDALGGQRNDYDKLGHVAQGFIPAIIAREVMIRKAVFNSARWRDFFIVSLCLGISAVYETDRVVGGAVLQGSSRFIPRHTGLCMGYPIRHGARVLRGSGRAAVARIVARSAVEGCRFRALTPARWYRSSLRQNRICPPFRVSNRLRLQCLRKRICRCIFDTA